VWRRGPTFGGKATTPYDLMTWGFARFADLAIRIKFRTTMVVA